MPLILGTNSIKDTGYDVANSCRFNDGDSAYMHKTPGSAGNQIQFTVSLWCKRGTLGTKQTLFSAVNDANNETECHFETDDTLNFRDNEGGSWMIQKRTTQVFRDCSAWYHLVFSSVSGTQKIWVNGVEVTSWTTNTNGSGTATWNDDNVMTVGAKNDGSSPQDYFDGYIAEFVSIDGLTLTPTSFGEFDEDSPTIWKPIDVSGLTFGTNGFYLDFEASDNLGNDANGGTDLTEVNLAAADQATDTPTNNFATLNPLYHYIGGAALSEGNLKFTTSGNSSLGRAMSTIRPENGKWYVECKVIDVTRFSFGLMNGNETNSTQGGNDTNSVIIDYLGGLYMAGGFSGYTAAPSNNEIVQLALDLDNDLFWIGINDTWGNSATRGEIEAATATNSGSTDISSTVPIDTGAIGIFVEDNSGTGNHVSEINFGNPTFSISSGNADANGYGNFEYAVPSGFYALCTKNLAEFG